MKEIMLTAVIGTVAGIIDVAPMIRMKLDKHEIASAFVFYFILPFVIFNVHLFQRIWVLKGGIIAITLALPIIIIVSKENKKAVSPMFIMSAVLGTLIGVTGYLVL